MTKRISGLFIMLTIGFFTGILFPGDLSIKKIGEWGSGNNNTLGEPLGVYVSGNYAYVADFKGGLHIIDVSDPVFPYRVGVYGLQDSTLVQVKGVKVKDNYAYIAAWVDSLQIVDVSNPASPVKIGEAPVVGFADNLFINGKHVYVGSSFAFSVIDVSDPSNPVFKGKRMTSQYVSGICASDNYAYTANSTNGLVVFDVSDPTAPVEIGSYGATRLFARDVFLQGNYVYLAADDNGLLVFDISSPSSPQLLGKYDQSLIAEGVYVVDDYAYVGERDGGLQVINVSDPSNPTLAGQFKNVGPSRRVFVKGNYVYLTDKDNGKLVILYLDWSSTSPRIQLNRSSLDFASDGFGTATPAQSLFITNSGGGSLDWTVSTNQDWLNCSPGSGTNSGEILVSVNTTGLLKGKYTGTVTVSDPDASNSPQTVEVTLKVLGFGETSVPFGVYATPVDGTTVSGSIPVTGWVLDDIGVQGLGIFREEGKNLVFIGDAVFVEGARPDVEQAYPGYPMNYKAGWGYMMLTNFLPNSGNGTFKIHAVATDIEGNQVTLGVKTIICDNANAVKPFGAIDTPTQGGAASGSGYINFGWVLTPPPNSIPIDGSTIRVWVDGVSLGNPDYNNYREDIAVLFPGYNNSGGAGGYFYLDTTPYENGVHTIQWTATDDAGNTDGIGSRYFTIQNTGNDSGVKSRGQGGLPPCFPLGSSPHEPIYLKKGYNPEIEPQMLYPGEDGVVNIRIRELERVEIRLSEGTRGLAPLSNGDKFTNSHLTGFQIIGSQLRSLPIGSFLDPETGIFSWNPGPGHYGLYTLLFLEKFTSREILKKYIQIRIVSKYGDDLGK